MNITPSPSFAVLFSGGGGERAERRFGWPTCEEEEGLSSPCPFVFSILLPLASDAHTLLPSFHTSFSRLMEDWRRRRRNQNGRSYSTGRIIRDGRNGPGQIHNLLHIYVVCIHKHPTDRQSRPMAIHTQSHLNISLEICICLWPSSDLTYSPCLKKGGRGPLLDFLVRNTVSTTAATILHVQFKRAYFCPGFFLCPKLL